MVESWEYKYRVKKFFKFEKEEIIGIFITTLIMALIWGYNDGRDSFTAYWFFNYVKSFLMVGIAMLIQISSQKLFAIYHGYIAEYKYWMTGLIIGVIVAVLTNGFWPVFLPGGIGLMHLSRLRIGMFRYGLNVWQSSQIAIIGPFANVIAVMFLKAVIWQILGIDSGLLDEFFKLNIIIAIYSMLPIPPLSGAIAFFGSKLTYVYVFSLMLVYVLLIVIFNFYSLIWAGVLGFFIYLVYLIKVENS